MFETKDSGERAEYSSGMVRDTNTGKPRYDLMIPLNTSYDSHQAYQLLVLLDLPSDPDGRYYCLLDEFLKWWHGESTAVDLFALMVERDGALLQRFAELLGRGAEKYDARNWELAAGAEEFDRFRESAFRHFIQWLRHDTDEDHAAAVVFNVRAANWLHAKVLSAKTYHQCICCKVVRERGVFGGYCEVCSNNLGDCCRASV